MNLKHTVQEGTKKAFRSLTSMKETFDYYEQLSASSYNPDTGTNERDERKHAAVEGMFIHYQEREVDGTMVLPTDKRVLIEERLLDFTSNQGDRIVTSDGVSWEVVMARVDLAKSIRVVQVRR